jgi:hypothetical protein
MQHIEAIEPTDLASLEAHRRRDRQRRDFVVPTAGGREIHPGVLGEALASAACSPMEPIADGGCVISGADRPGKA